MSYSAKKREHILRLAWIQFIVTLNRIISNSPYSHISSSHRSQLILIVAFGVFPSPMKKVDMS